MFVKGRKSRQWRYKRAHHGDTVKAIFERGCAARRHFSVGKASGAVRGRGLLANALT